MVAPRMSPKARFCAKRRGLGQCLWPNHVGARGRNTGGAAENGLKAVFVSAKCTFSGTPMPFLLLPLISGLLPVDVCVDPLHEHTKLVQGITACSCSGVLPVPEPQRTTNLLTTHATTCRVERGCHPTDKRDNPKTEATPEASQNQNKQQKSRTRQWLHAQTTVQTATSTGHPETRRPYKNPSPLLFFLPQEHTQCGYNLPTSNAPTHTPPCTT